MTKTELTFSAFSLTFVDFTVQFCFRCKFIPREAVLVKFDSGVIFLDHSQLLVMHSNQWDCFILYREQITSNGFFWCLPKWAKACFRAIEKDFEIKSWNCLVFFLLYKTNRFHVAVCLFSNRSQRTSKCGKNISDTLGYRLVCHFLFLPHFNAICDLLLNRRTPTWNLFVKWIPTKSLSGNAVIWASKCVAMSIFSWSPPVSLGLPCSFLQASVADSGRPGIY